MKDLSYKQKYLLIIRSLQCIATTIGISLTGLLALVQSGIVVM